jgi:hypothetical protein
MKGRIYVFIFLVLGHHNHNMLPMSLLMLCVGGTSVDLLDVIGCDQHQFLNNTCEPAGAYDKVTVSNLCACQESCDANPTCDHWVYNSKQTDNNCHFKNAPKDPSKYQTGNCTIGPNSRPPPPPTPAPLGPPSDAKNVLFFVVDDLRNELGYSDHRKGVLTPNIDALSAKSLVFDRAYVQQVVDPV